MAILFRCPDCGYETEVGEEYIGKKVECPGCHKYFRVYSEEGEGIPPSGLPPPDEGFRHPSEPIDFQLRTPSGEGLPWDNRKEVGFWNALFGTIKLVLFNPTEAFSRMNITGGLGNPLLFYIILGTSAAEIGIFWQVLFHFISPAGEKPLPPELAKLFPVISPIFFIALAILMPLLITIGSFIGSGVLHLCLMIVGGAQREFEATFRVYNYSMGATSLWQAIPFCGGLISAIWYLVCVIIGLREAHGITTGKALFAVFLPVILGCCCGILAAIFLPAIIGGGGIPSLSP